MEICERCLALADEPDYTHDSYDRVICLWCIEQMNEEDGSE